MNVVRGAKKVSGAHHLKRTCAKRKMARGIPAWTVRKKAKDTWAAIHDTGKGSVTSRQEQY